MRRVFAESRKFAKSTESIIEKPMECNPFSTPTILIHKLEAYDPPNMDTTLYNTLVGALQYLTFMKCDIAFIVQHICLFMHDPHKQRLHTLKHILQYLHETPEHGLQIHISSPTSLILYFDTDWGGWPTNRHSTPSYCLFLGDNIIYWSSTC